MILLTFILRHAPDLMHRSCNRTEMIPFPASGDLLPMLRDYNIRSFSGRPKLIRAKSSAGASNAPVITELAPIDWASQGIN